MEKTVFIGRVLEAAKKAGIVSAEVYYSASDSFRAMSHQGEVDNYSAASRAGLSLRGLYEGKMGYAATEALDDEAIDQLVQGVMESAMLVEDDAPQEIWHGDGSYPEVDNYSARSGQGNGGTEAETAAGYGKSSSFLRGREDQTGQLQYGHHTERGNSYRQFLRCRSLSEG